MEQRCALCSGLHSYASVCIAVVCFVGVVSKAPLCLCSTLLLLSSMCAGPLVCVCVCVGYILSMHVCESVCVHSCVFCVRRPMGWECVRLASSGLCYSVSLEVPHGALMCCQL